MPSTPLSQAWPQGVLLCDPRALRMLSGCMQKRGLRRQRMGWRRRLAIWSSAWPVAAAVRRWYCAVLGVAGAAPQVAHRRGQRPTHHCQADVRAAAPWSGCANFSSSHHERAAHRQMWPDVASWPCSGAIHTLCNIIILLCSVSSPFGCSVSSVQAVSGLPADSSSAA